MFTFFQLLTLQTSFCDSGEAGETKVFLQTRGRRRTCKLGVGGCCLNQEGPIESFWNIIRQTDLQEEWPRYTEGIMDYIVAEMAVTYSKTLAKLERV